MLDKKVLLIEPYYGGSHKQFLEGMVKYVDADYTLLQLPARKWKMRMQLAAPWFVQKVKEMGEKDRQFDLVLMSSFMDVAVFRALVGQVKGWHQDTRFLTYFHENQFSYPGVLAKETTHQFTSINFTTALASDRLAYNSTFNMDSFMSQCRKYLKKATDIELRGELAAIIEKSSVLYPGIDFQDQDAIQKPGAEQTIPLIIWNHRWEHDKNPEEFFDVIYSLDQENIPFRLAILGQSFRNQPEIFSEAKTRLAHRIDHFGFVPDKEKYYRLLNKGSFVVSTAFHEFFGISILEGIRAGCLPVVPDRLSYPELLDENFLYREGMLYDVLKYHLTRKSTLGMDRCMEITSNYCWSKLADKYKSWFQFENIIES